MSHKLEHGLWYYSSTCAGGSCINSASTTQVACIVVTCTGNISSAGIASVKDVCIESVCAVERLGILLQSF